MSYYATEGGIEDALVRLKKNPQIILTNYNLYFNNGVTTVNVDIPGIIGGSRTIIAIGTTNKMTRKVEVVSSMDGDSVSFHYGAQAGEGGLVMKSGSRIIGNVFSNGNISGSGTIDNDAVVSGNGHSIAGVYVKGDAKAYSCLSTAKVDGDLTYVVGGEYSCEVAGEKTPQDNEINQQSLPIPEDMINQWRADAEAVPENNVIGNKIINSSQTYGPAKITGDLTIGNGVTITLTGTVYVQGNINLGNTNTIKLSSSYAGGGSSGVILSDGIIDTGNGTTFSGSGQEGSYILILSTNSSDSAISVSNNSTGAVFYTSAGGLTISNNVSVVEATGYKIIMNNNSTIQYSSGIANIFFSSGPSAGWKVTSWQEK
jgi:hypothetical protein